MSQLFETVDRIDRSDFAAAATERTAKLERLLTAVAALRTAWIEDADTASPRIAAAKEEVVSITKDLQPKGT